MKFYESHYEEYIASVERYNLHPELEPIMEQFPKRICDLENLIIYGPPGAGKYSQLLYLLKRYSPSHLKYDKKIVAQTEKQQYIYRISDIHFEVDMSLLGCNSKILWHEIFFQIVDIISVKPDKIGIIVCKNFHLIHAELLEIFYSYIQQYNHSQTNIKIKFVFMMEHVSFLPTPIVNACHLLRIKRPSRERYEHVAELSATTTSMTLTRPFLQRISECRLPVSSSITSTSIRSSSILKNIELEGLLNIKEIRSFPLLLSEDEGGEEGGCIGNGAECPKDIFNTICDNIIKEILSPKTISFTGFRDTLYDILTYNLDMTECLWYILKHIIENQYLSKQDASDVLIKTYTFLKYYNNNYRPIYHLESIAFYIINKIHKYP